MIKKTLIALLTTLAIGGAQAQAAAPTVTITWSAPTANTDGTALTGALTYQLYVGTKGAEVKYKTPVTSPPYVLVPTPSAGSQVCAQVTATASAVESAPSAEVCTQIPQSTPNAPSNVTITLK